MKLVLAAVMAIALGSCSSSEWTEEDEKTFLDECNGQTIIDCDCALKKAKEKYPDINEWKEKGGKDKELAEEVAKDC